MFFRRNTRAIQGVQTDLNRVWDILKRLVDTLEIIEKNEGYLMSHLGNLGSRVAETTGDVSRIRSRLENLPTRMICAEGDIARLKDHLIHLLEEPLPETSTYRPLTGIRRELCPTD